MDDRMVLLNPHFKDSKATPAEIQKEEKDVKAEQVKETQPPDQPLQQ